VIGLLNPGLPDENFNKKPNNAKKRPEKGQTLFVVLPSFVTKKYLNYKNIKKIFFKIKTKSCLALYWSTDLP